MEDQETWPWKNLVLVLKPILKSGLTWIHQRSVTLQGIGYYSACPSRGWRRDIQLRARPSAKASLDHPSHLVKI
jgi:hypothetical protein